MSSEVVQLLPTMTVQQVAAWCAYHGKAVRIEWRVKANEIEPLLIVEDDLLARRRALKPSQPHR